MTTRRTRRRRLGRSAALLAVPGIVLALVVSQGSVQALTEYDTPAPVTGNATWFSGLGGPYGGCGMTQDALETQDFVALNVYDTPGDYTYYPRPLTGDDLDKRGMWDNGHNCGRWVRVTIAEYCTGVNDGARGEEFCRNGDWVEDGYEGATLDMIVADSCGDDNAWCREDPYHLDLSRDSLNRFVKDGAPVGDMDPDHWNNRHVTWQFIEAPDYTGDIQIGFLQGAQTWWGAIAISHLPNGIHGVEYYVDGTWSEATMDGDMGQAYVVKPLQEQGRDFRIRVRDADDQLVNGGREYSFSLPDTCQDQCEPAYTQVEYTTTDPVGVSPEPTSSDPTTSSATPTGTGTSAPPSAATCTASYRTVSSWPGGYLGEVVVTAGNVPVNSWEVTWTQPDGGLVTSAWNTRLTISGATVTAANEFWNGTVAAGSSTTFGFLGSGVPTELAPVCSAI